MPGRDGTGPLGRAVSNPSGNEKSTNRCSTGSGQGFGRGQGLGKGRGMNNGGGAGSMGRNQ